jgi:tight adherence protein B
MVNATVPRSDRFRRGFGAGIGSSLRLRIERAALSIKPEELTMGIIVAAACGWIATVVFAHPAPLLGIAIFPAALAASYGAVLLFLEHRAAARRKAFLQQLELVLRMLGSALRAGLGLRQAMISVTEEIAEPARGELTHVIGQTNIGISIHDALDALAERMPSSEMLIAVRTIRAQSQTGGDLAKILEKVANTIRDRRRIQQKIRALTAEGRASGYIIAALPPLLGVVISFTQHAMAHALFYTPIGHITLAIVAVLEAAAGFTISRILKFDV